MMGVELLALIVSTAAAVIIIATRDVTERIVRRRRERAWQEHYRLRTAQLQVGRLADKPALKLLKGGKR